MSSGRLNSGRMSSGKLSSVKLSSEKLSSGKTSFEDSTQFQGDLVSSTPNSALKTFSFEDTKFQEYLLSRTLSLDFPELDIPWLNFPGFDFFGPGLNFKTSSIYKVYEFSDKHGTLNAYCYFYYLNIF